jgi:hypothetical protein
MSEYRERTTGEVKSRKANGEQTLLICHYLVCGKQQL